MKFSKMPIIIKEVEWNQTDNILNFKIPLRGVHSSKVDILCTPEYLKAAFEHFFYEVFLLHPINTEKSQCTFTPTHIVCELTKATPGLWPNLEKTLTKAEKQELKKIYFEEEENRIKNALERVANKKSELKRVAVREQMVLDTKQREKIETIKKNEKENALKEMKIWKPIKPPLITQSVPPPRRCETLTVTFTPREFSTPSRESRLEEENEWLRKQAEARRSVGFKSEDIRAEEKNPQFLKHKGDEFMQNRNFLGAVSAYSFGLKLNAKFVDLYVGRAEAHLALGNFNKAAQDCSTALELMKPEVPQNLRQRALCIGYRGIALIQLGVLRQGADELKASLKLVPNENFSLKLEEALENLSTLNEN